MMKKMNKKNIILGAMALLLTAICGCAKLSEDGPIENITKDVVFDTQDSLGVLSEQFLNNIYASLPAGNNRVGGNLLDAGSDDGLPNSTADAVQYYSLGSFNAGDQPDNVWDANYAAIRSVNIFLANIDKVPLNTPGLKLRWKAEARGLRALFYFELIKRWGGVPLLGDKVYTLDDNLKLSRNSYADCVSYIISELDAAMPSLLGPNSTSGALGAYYGRFTRGAAMALKSRLLLYAASPLNNPSNDLGKWSLAVAASKAIMDSVTAGKFAYSLSTVTTTAHYTTTTLAGVTTAANLTAYVANVNKFLNIFSTRSNTEVMLAYVRATTTDMEANNEPVGYTRAGLGKTNPTQELVDEYEMYNGKMIGEAGSGYSALTPYYNRDPRLPGTVFYNGLYWINRNVQTYDGGKDRPKGFGNATSGETRTGYYMRKFLTGSTSETSFSANNHNFPIFRYAEVLLNYAEAQNEAVGPDATVYSAVNAVRARVGMPALATGLSQVDMRTKIRHERRVEFAFEEHRFFDIRRWKIAENVLNGSLHGVQATLSSTTVTYNTVSVAPASFNASKMYLYPIPYKEIVSNSNMIQNPNW
jgi:hypothetical protein